MRQGRAWLLLLALAALAWGCAGVIEFRLPDEFKGRKLKEDPPLSLAPALDGVRA